MKTYHQPETMESLLKAILDDDRSKTKELLENDPALATGLVSKPRLYETGIFHWLYLDWAKSDWIRELLLT